MAATFAAAAAAAAAVVAAATAAVPAAGLAPFSPTPPPLLLLSPAFLPRQTLRRSRGQPAQPLLCRPPPASTLPPPANSWPFSPLPPNLPPLSCLKLAGSEGGCVGARPGTETAPHCA